MGVDGQTRTPAIAKPMDGGQPAKCLAKCSIAIGSVDEDFHLGGCASDGYPVRGTPLDTNATPGRGEGREANRDRICASEPSLAHRDTSNE